MTVYNHILELIGKTPLVELKAIEEKYNLKARLFAKIESFNPAGSVKDRTAYSLVESLKQDERYIRYLEEGRKISIVEATSGNTGIALAMICARLDYELIICVPESVSKERVMILEAFGAKVILTEGSRGMKGSIEKAMEFEDAFKVWQFENPYNPLIHENTTGKEIFEDMEGDLDIFVAGVGTGGTITGCARYFKKMGKDVEIVAVEPFESQVLSGHEPSKHGIAGIGAGFIPNIMDLSLVNRILAIKTEDAYKWANIGARTEGILCGVSSGAAICAAVELAKNEENKDKKIVLILPDTGERYLSTPLFEKKDQ